MWPWEHLAFGYLLFGALRRFWYLLAVAVDRTRRVQRPYADGRAAPSRRAVVVLVIATQLPDLVDKPLAWGLGVLPSGISLAHSVFVALPLAAFGLAVGHWLARKRATRGVAGPASTPRGPDVGSAFAVGYLSHLAGDVLYQFVVDGSAQLQLFLWPLVTIQAGNPQFLARVVSLWTKFVVFAGTPRGQLYLLAEAIFLSAAITLWLWDGAPGLSWWRPERG